MKRLLPIVPVCLLISLNACGTVGIPIPSNVGTAVGQTQTASIWTPTISATPDPDESKIVVWLNQTLLAADPLEQTLDAKYQVVDVLFPVAQDGSQSSVFRVDIRCDCASNVQCCIPERMFVVTIGAMKVSSTRIIEQVAGRANDMQVVCYDHAAPIGMLVATWADVKGYLLGEINGYQLGARVIKLPVP